jgi:hypothetical protein
MLPSGASLFGAPLIFLVIVVSGREARVHLSSVGVLELLNLNLSVTGD